MISQIDSPHPVDVTFGEKELSERQQRILGELPGFGSQAIVKKRDVSMLDLAALTAKTGDEFAMFTRKGDRLIIRGNFLSVPLTPNKAEKLRSEGYRWSGHTHIGINDESLIASDGDRKVLKAFNQSKSLIYNAAGKHAFVKQVIKNVP